MNDKSSFDFMTLLRNMAIVLPPVFLYTVKSDYPHYLLIASVILIFAFLQKNYLAYRDRPIIYCTTLALVLTAIPDLLVSIDDSRVGLFDLVVRSNLAIPFLSYLAAFSCAFFPHPQRLGFTAACSAGAMLICGDRFNSETLSNTLMPFLNIPLRNYMLTYACMVTLQVLVLPFFFYSAYSEKKSAGQRFPPGNRIAKIICILMIPVFAVAATRFYYKNESFMRTVEYYLLRVGMKRYMPQQGTRFLSPEVDLNATRSPELSKDPNMVLFRAKADATPGYLRGGVYTLYENGRWTAPTASPEQLAVTRRTTILSYSTFNVREGIEFKTPSKIELYFDHLRTGGVIPAPGNTFRLEAVADSGELTPSGIFTLKQWRLDGGCTLYVPSIAPDSVWQNPKPDNPDLLAVPKAIRNSLAAHVPPGVKNPNNSDLAKTLALRLFFHQNFTYSLADANRNPDGDPIVYFLSQTRKGHCELFAASAVLLLRTQGIPARYVTGFICGEKSPIADYYIVRASHAHAWCEAYLRDEKRWVLVEATPDNGLSGMPTPKDSSARAVYDLMKQLFQQAFADVRRGHFANAVMTLLMGLFGFLWSMVKTVPGGIASFLLVAAAVFFYYRKKQKRLQKRRLLLSPEMRLLSAKFAAFEKEYASHSGIRRPPETTLLEHYANTNARELCLRYEELRYRTRPPTPAEIQEFEQMIQKRLRS